MKSLGCMSLMVLASFVPLAVHAQQFDSATLPRQNLGPADDVESWASGQQGSRRSGAAR